MSKYHAVPLDSQGRSRQVCDFLGTEFLKAFDSTGEYNRWCELLQLQEAGKIEDLQRQMDFDLHVTDYMGAARKIGKYVADFVYLDLESGEDVIEDFKGVRTAIYSWKKRHMAIEHGITIKETHA